MCRPHHIIQGKEGLWFSFVFLRLPSRSPHSHLFLLCLRFIQNEHRAIAPDWNPRPCETDTLCNPVPCSRWDADTLRNSVLVHGGMQSQVAPFLGRWLLFLFYQYHFLPGCRTVYFKYDFGLFPWSILAIFHSSYMNILIVHILLACICVHTPQMHLEVRGQLIGGAGSIIPFCESQKAKSKFPGLTTQVEKNWFPINKIKTSFL